MELRILTRAEIKRIYRAHLTYDFPPEERKPLSIIMDALNRSQYLCYGLFQGNKVLGYAFLVRTQQSFLLDYLAILRDFRNQGLGTELMQLLTAALSNADSILAEVEDPDCASDEAERLLRTRRLQFYLRCGFTDPGITVKTFGVLYRILESSPTPSPETLADRYCAHYRASLPAWLYRSQIRR